MDEFEWVALCREGVCSSDLLPGLPHTAQPEPTSVAFRCGCLLLLHGSWNGISLVHLKPRINELFLLHFQVLMQAGLLFIFYVWHREFCWSTVFPWWLGEDPVLPPHQISRCQGERLRGATISKTQAKPNTNNMRWDIWDIKTSETKKKKKDSRDSFCHGSKFIPYYFFHRATVSVAALKPHASCSVATFDCRL